MIVALWIVVDLVAAAVAYLYITLLLWRQQTFTLNARIVRLENAMDKIHSVQDIMKEQPKMMKLRCKPDENCKHCHGLGHIGKDTATGLFIPCGCCA